MINLFGTTIDELERGLAFATRRHEILARNIANIDTPGYRAQDLVLPTDFRAALDAALPDVTSTGPTPVDVAHAPRLVQAGDMAPDTNGNDVNLDQEMARLSENTLFHQTLVQLLAGQFAALKQAIGTNG